MNFRKIIDAWIISFNPSEDQMKMAEARGKICDDCESKTVTLQIAFCDECGCPIGKKIFTNDFNSCDLKKWGNVDSKYFPEQKKNRSII